MSTGLAGPIPFTFPVDRLTLHRWIWGELAAEARREGEFGLRLAEIVVGEDETATVAFPPHAGARDHVHVVAWFRGAAMLWQAPLAVLPGDTVSQQLPIAGEIGRR